VTNGTQVFSSKYFLDKVLVTVVEIKLVRAGGDIKIFGAATCVIE
jgi:hypothetical protein